MYVEVNADCLIDDTTADWGAINESSKIKQEIEKALMPFLEESMKEGSKMEMAAAKARHQKKINAYLAKQPEYRKIFAKAALEKVIEINAKYMCMLDADDLYYYDKLEWQYDSQFQQSIRRRA